MSEPRATAPRPVADAPVEELQAAAPELAKRWLMALIATHDLAHAPRLPVGALADEAPALIAGLLRSLSSDAALEQLLRGADAETARRAGTIAGARDAPDAVRAVEALREVLWDALIDALREARPAQVADLAARLGHAAAQVAALAAGAAPTGATAAPAPAAGAPAAPTAPPPAPAAPPAPAPAGTGPGVGEPTLGGPEPSTAGRREATVVPFAAPATLPGHSEITDTPDEGPAAWIGSIGRRLERFAEDRRPFAVLLIEIADIDRLRSAIDAAPLSELVAAVERALGAELRPADVLTREGPGRYWLVTPETDHTGAAMLAERLAEAVRAGAEHRGVPLNVAVGTAVCPDDDEEAAGLAARADVGVYAARAAGRATAPVGVL